ncbi:MAG: glycosyltransferase [Deltaproteobacteria bacterium]|nr:glycosyltransferase [Deltaproteobacteria bacterium]MBI3294743.1 glycosyltransferase [Deltaproteobacteria bacterium]
MRPESSLSFILPTLNERENIIPVIESVLQAHPQIGQIIVVDDDSTDGTLEAVETHFLSNILKGQLSVIHRTSEPGLTPSLRDAVKAVNTSHVGWMDCDGSTPIEALKMLIQKMGTHDLAVASRFAFGGHQKSVKSLGKDSFWEVVLSNILNWCLDRIFHLPVTDLTSGFIVMKTSLAKQIDFRGCHGEYFIFLLLQAQRLGARLTEVPYACGTRQHGHSKTFGSPRAILLNLYRYSRAFLVALWEARSRSNTPALSTLSTPAQ